MNFTYGVYANGAELLETEDRAQAIRLAKAKADELQTRVTVCENDESNGEQREIMQVNPK